MTEERKKRRTFDYKKRSEFLWGWFLVLPTIIGLIILNIIPIICTIYQSFFKTGDFGRGNIFIGLTNYKKLFADTQVMQAVGNTIKYAAVEVPVSIAIALVLAVLLNKKIKMRGTYRTIIFLPMVAAPAAVAMVWRWLYNTEFGLINHVFGVNISWISDPRIAIYSIALVGIWSVIGYNMILFIAGLQEIPKDFYEAAEIDGATGLRQFFQITLPLLSPTIFFVSVVRIISALQVFDLIYMMISTSNPALQDTQSLVYLFYRYSFTQKDIGYGSTIVVLLLAITMVVTVFQLIAQKKWVHYD